MVRRYEMKDPKGRTVIGFEKHVFVCENKRPKDHPRHCCSKKSKYDLKMLFKKELEKKNNVNVRINSAGCLDFCEQGPTVVIYPECVWYSIKNPEKDIPDIVNEHLISGNIVKRCLIKL
jgi:(2Fe-2S) ferredoxin|tara:strand:+ start:1813 stop:2169 length:357 start_codon:yes stop_codon:yes gene_type:complete